MRFFLDTNVIVYTLDQGAPAKRRLALEWLTELAARSVIVISPQIVNETANVLVHKLKAEMPAIRAAVQGIARWCTGPFGPTTTDQALQIRERYKFDWWDCLIVASAISAPATTY